MASDWQDTAFSTRHVHNRSRKGGTKGKATPGSGAVDVTKLFGTYSISCPSAAKLAGMATAEKYEGRLDVYCLNEEKNGLLAELLLPGVMHAHSVVLAGSRRVLADVVRDLQTSDHSNDGDDGNEGDEGDEVESEGSRAEQEGGDGEDDDDDDDEDEAGAFEEDPAAQRDARGNNFEKNSFRSFKFWVRYQAQLLTASSADDRLEHVEASGYWIWPGSRSDRFQGTISCSEFGWDNVKIEGWRKKSSNARDYQVKWESI